MLKKSQIIKILLIIVIFLGVGGAGYFFGFKQRLGGQTSVVREKNKYLAFLFEVYDKIQENYWDKISDEELVNIFKLGIEKLTGQPQSLKENNKQSLEKLLNDTLKQIETEEKKKEFAATLADVVLANLKPFGRSRLYSKKEEKALSDTIKNINPDVDHYESLEVDKDVSGEEISKAFEGKTIALKTELDQSTEPEKKAEIEGNLKKVEDAYKVLSESDSREVYDDSGVEPTMDYRLIRPKIFYIHIKKFSPTTLDELKRVTEKVDNIEGLDSLILDLQDNIGGSIDLLPYFLGPFIGQDQYAYQFFSQGEKVDFTTKTGWLPSLIRYKKVIVLINQGTQSSAELMAATLKKYNVGIVVGTPTKGWGTIERVFPIEKQLEPDERYSIFLVHSLTLRDDSQPIEGKGVDPLIDVNDSNWQEQLYAYFHYNELVEATKEVIANSPSL